MRTSFPHSKQDLDYLVLISGPDLSEPGLRRSLERPPEDHWAVRNEEYEQQLLTKYYDFKGWTFDGIPTKETLEKLSLGYVAQDL
jgi:aldehyde:ferredoxin oxidoreductase